MQYTPVEIRLRKQSRLLTVTFEGDESFDLPFEYLRISSPSAEVQGHGPGQGTLPLGKEDVQVRELEPVGHYAVRIIFDDGHDSGLYTWKYLHELGIEQTTRWQAYLDRKAKAAQGQPGR